MRNKRRISKEWLKHRREITENFLHWVQISVVKAFLVFAFIFAVLFFFDAIQDDNPLVRKTAICLGDVSENLKNAVCDVAGA